MKASVAFSLVFLVGCAANTEAPVAAIRITRVPQADGTGSTKTDVIEGTALGATSQDRVVLYAQTGTWWVQPSERGLLTRLSSRLCWTNGTHLGTKYAALLVDGKFSPANNLVELPKVGGMIKAETEILGRAAPPSPAISFSGYQ